MKPGKQGTTKSAIAIDEVTQGACQAAGKGCRWGGAAAATGGGTSSPIFKFHGCKGEKPGKMIYDVQT